MSGAVEGVAAAVNRCVEIIRKQQRDFLSPEYATGQPLSSLKERFACEECVRAIEHEFGLTANTQSGLPSPAQRPTLASLRTAAGLTLRQVEAAVNGRFSNALLSQLETGKIKRPSATVLVDLAGVYGVPVNVVFEAAGVNPDYVSDEPRSDRFGRPLAPISGGSHDQRSPR